MVISGWLFYINPVLGMQRRHAATFLSEGFSRVNSLQEIQFLSLPAGRTVL